MKRNKSIDIVRAIAILIIVFYHAYTLTGNPYSGLFLSRFFELGGEVGVTLFFLISGFGIYLSLASDDRKGQLTYGRFLRRRVVRILPQYYVCCVVLLLFTSQASLLSKAGLPHLITHALLIHNLWANTNGSINGALWTMGTVFQFYLISVLLYRAIKRRPVLTLVASVVASMLCKYLIYHVGLAPRGAESILYFIYGRQLLPALDNFVVGMFLSWLLSRPKMQQESTGRQWLFALPCLAGMGALVLWMLPISHYGLYGDFPLAYCWHSVLALLLGATVFFFTQLPFRYSSPLSKGLLFVSKNQYGIYLWHMPLIQTLLGYSTVVQGLLSHSFAITFLVILALAIVVGTVSTRLIDHTR